MRCLDSEPRIFFLQGMRLSFGLWLFYVAMVKWVQFGPTPFVGMITSQFDPTWSPHLLNSFLAWLILVAEPVLAIAILLGKCQRATWTLTACLMFLLIIGQTILMKPDVIANWQYFVLTLACAALSDGKNKNPQST